MVWEIPEHTGSNRYPGASAHTQKYRNMKACLRTHAVLANPDHSEGYVCGLRLRLRARSATFLLVPIALRLRTGRN